MYSRNVLSSSALDATLIRSLKMFTLVLAIFCLLLDSSLGVVTQASRYLDRQNFVHRVVLDQMGAFVMLWTPYEDEIIFEIQVRSKGYVGLGFSPTGGMKNADIVIAWIDNFGKVHFSDRHGIGNITPVEDESQDYKLLGAVANGTHTVIRFSRPWITCDSRDDVALSDDTTRVIWAYDALQPDPSKSSLSYHDHRGTRSIYLKEPKMKDTPAPGQTQTWDIRAPEVELPGDLHTLYWCKLYKVPNLPWKHQVIGYIPLIDAGSLPHVHHMLLYECSMPSSDLFLDRWTTERGAQCYSKNMPMSWTACGTPIIAWAIGSQGEMLPDHVGFPLGEKHGGATYFLLEIHYDNPKLKKGLLDKSGLRLFLTDQLRQHDAGTLTLGHKVEPTMMIPPGRVWKTKAHCTADCTDNTIPVKGINVFSGILHAHMLGAGISLQHIRNGIEREPIIKDGAYDFNYQQARYFKKEKVILPGDHMITTCTYNATKRTKPTFGDYGTDDEMCLVFLNYYPRINLGECYSRPDVSVLFDIFGIQNIYDKDRIMNLFSEHNFDNNRISLTKEDSDFNKMISSRLRTGLDSDNFRLVDFLRIINISEPLNMRGKSFYDIVTDEKTWDEELINSLEKAITSFQYEPSCLYSGRGMVHGLPKKAKTPHYISYRPRSEVCVPSSVQQSYDSPSQAIDGASQVDKRDKKSSKKQTGGLYQQPLHRSSACKKSPMLISSLVTLLIYKLIM